MEQTSGEGLNHHETEKKKKKKKKLSPLQTVFYSEKKYIFFIC